MTAKDGNTGSDRPSDQRGRESAAPGKDTSGNGAGGGSEGIFTKPAPEGAAKRMSEVLGEIVWLMSQSKLHRMFYIQDLEWFVMTPVLLGQFHLFYQQDRPLGVVLWGSVSDEVEAVLARGTNKLRPQDWKSGDKLWAVEVIAPFGGAEEMVKDLKAKVFPDREVKYLALQPDGKPAVRSV